MSWMTQTDAAAALGCSIRTIRRRIRRDTLNARREGRNILVEINTDECSAMVHSAPARLPTTLVASTPVLDAKTADEFAAMSTTLKDAVSAFSDYHQTLHVETRQARRSARTAWLVTCVFAVAFALGGWLYHVADVNHTAAMNKSQTTLVAAQARHAGETDAQQTMAQIERAKTMNLQGKNAALIRSLAEASAHRDQAAIDRATLVSQRDELALKLSKADRAAGLADMVRDLSSVAALGLQELARGNELQRARRQMQSDQERHERELAAATARYAKLARSSAQRDGELQALEGTIEHERQTISEAQARLETMAHKLIAAATDRARLELQRDQLTAEVEALKTRLQKAQGVAALQAIVHDLWSITQLAISRTGFDRGKLANPDSPRQQLCKSDAAS